MTSTYFAKDPVPQVTIPPAFDAKLVKATLAELESWDGPWPTFTDEASLRVALGLATSAAQIEKLRKYTERSPALHAAFLRLVPSKHWNAGKSVYDNLTNVFALIRGLPCKNPHTEDLVLSADADHLTDDELIVLFPALVNESNRETRYESDAIARRVTALATTEEHVLRLWEKAKLLPWRLARALSDAQMLQVHAWAVLAELDPAARGRRHVPVRRRLPVRRRARPGRQRPVVRVRRHCAHAVPLTRAGRDVRKLHRAGEGIELSAPMVPGRG